MIQIGFIHIQREFDEAHLLGEVEEHRGQRGWPFAWKWRHQHYSIKRSNLSVAIVMKILDAFLVPQCDHDRDHYPHHRLPSSWSWAFTHRHRRVKTKHLYGLPLHWTESAINLKPELTEFRWHTKKENWNWKKKNGNKSAGPQEEWGKKKKRNQVEEIK